MAQKLISMFVTDMPTRLDQLELACNEIDVTNIKAVAHSITGSSASMRCSVLADIAEKIEDTTKYNSFENLDILIAELKEEWETVKHLLLQKIEH